MTLMEIIIIGCVSAVWMGGEAYLLARDRVRGKGSTAIDRRSRAFNTLSLVLGLAAAFAFSWITLFRWDPDSPILYWTGIGVCGLGMALRYWSIAVLGRHFRTTVEWEKNQRVVTRGPYRFIRHPSYSGILLFCLGYGAALQNWISLILAFGLPLAALLYRISIEEKALLAGLGEDYRRYREHTKKLIPGVW
jgi:protein-S-isoprenylcysteine O-methyltransferase Ste14